jgi:hypothetical protein
VTEQQGTERTHGKAGGEGQQRKDEGGRRLDAGKELLGEDGGKRAVDVEVVPLEHRADR